MATVVIAYGQRAQTELDTAETEWLELEMLRAELRS